MTWPWTRIFSRHPRRWCVFFASSLSPEKKGSMWSRRICLIQKILCSWLIQAKHWEFNTEHRGYWRMEEYLSTEILDYFHLANLPGTPPKVSSIPFFHMEKKSRLSVSSSGLLFTTSECFSMVKVSFAGSWGGATLSDPSFRPNCTSCYSADKCVALYNRVPLVFCHYFFN